MRYLPAVCFILLIAQVSPAAGEDPAAAGQRTFGHSAALGVNYPGVNFKLFFSDTFAAEVRGQYADKVLTGGVRGYYYPSILGFNNARLRPFLGVEGDYLSFRDRLSKGSGTAFGAVGGLEYFLSERVSVQTDSGPFYIALQDGRTALRQGGLEFVLDFDVDFYFE